MSNGDCTVAESLENSMHACLARTRKLGDACGQAPLEEIALELDATDPWRGYRYLPPKVTQRFSEVQQQLGKEGLADYLGLLLQHYIRGFASRFAELRLTAPFAAEFDRVFRRMLRQCTDATLRASPHDDVFLKDLAIARGRMIPCVSHLIYRYSGVSRRAVFMQPPQRLPSVLAFFARLGGFRPFLENHVHPAMLDDFNAEGRQRCYRLVAELLRSWPESKGLIGASWYYDPRVRQISPNLAYLHDEPIKYGALIMKLATEGANSGALARSKHRQRLFEAGEYMPTTYLMVWPRRDILSQY